MSLFSRFGVEIPKSLTEANIIGVDFDDDDLSAASVEEGSRNPIHTLFADVEQYKRSLKNILCIDIETNKVFRFGFPGMYRDCFCASNFLCYPGSIKSKKKIAKDNGISLTNAECMQYAFNLFINKLFEYDCGRIDKEKHSILLVSRPASSCWESNEKKYAALLKEKLEIKDYSQQVDIVIVSELQSLCTLLVRDGGPVSPEENVVIMKCGSNSFDMAVARRGDIPANWEYSRLFGTGKIEDLMLKQFLDEQPGKKPVKPIAQSKLFLRKLKEQFYGTDNEPGDNKNFFRIIFENKPKPIMVYKQIDDEFMEQTLNNTGPVTIEASMDGIDQEEYASWHEACMAVFNGAKHHVKKCLKGDQLHKIILTGGASVMPEVQQIAQECFGGAKFVRYPCNHLIANSLAYVGAFEIVQQQLREFDKAFNDIFFP